MARRRGRPDLPRPVTIPRAGIRFAPPRPKKRAGRGGGLVTYSVQPQGLPAASPKKRVMLLHFSSPILHFASMKGSRREAREQVVDVKISPPPRVVQSLHECEPSCN